MYNARSVLKLYGGNGQMAVSGLMRFANLSEKEAEEAVLAAGGSLDPVDWAEKADTATGKPRSGMLAGRCPTAGRKAPNPECPP